MKNLFKIEYKFTNSDCRMCTHERCQGGAPLPCVPMIGTPPRTPKKKKRYALGDIAPELDPRIPGQLIRCVVALEKRHLAAQGLYRVTGYIFY
jgi:hypothetical protein